MIRIKFDPNNLPPERTAEWEYWLKQARVAQKGVIDQWETWKVSWSKWKANPEGDPPEFKPLWNDAVWKELRDWLLKNVFHHKCAYCESPKIGYPGDTEHFRPKGRVRVKLQDDRSEVVTVVDENGNQIPHPGYFWLAYHWKNLLPACETCNRAGKKDLFPVENSHVAVRRLTVSEIDALIEKLTRSDRDESVFYLEPNDLDQIEGRLLLHPYDDDPREHIYFQMDGKAAARQGSQLGNVSIEVYRLNDDDTKRARNREQLDGLRM